MALLPPPHDPKTKTDPGPHGKTDSHVKLTFQIHTGLLTGTVGGKHLKIHAFSGGRGGSKTKGAAEDGVVNNPDKVDQKTDHAHGVHGGPIPPGTYRIGAPAQHAHLGLSAALYPDHNNKMFHRGGFYIHGRGKHGSDGCVVPANPSDFQRLMHALTASHGGTLHVVR